eukprot:TRINITY_DN101184_c0_g1_i1.p1 TRINITY_DN101184_c0_g1~~TRINITY_DN101184_c0_g1_i1.p1  ORF type:complete len:585 (+),score=182.02 TRINITY_DN101184_c0_g1_i1:126-1880(+)
MGGGCKVVPANLPNQPQHEAGEEDDSPTKSKVRHISPTGSGPSVAEESVDHSSVGVTEDELENAKYHDGFFGRLAKNKYFDMSTNIVILFNALQIGYDSDYSARFDRPDNLYNGPLQFVIAENAFAVYFTGEILVRLFAYKRARDMLCDAWLIFDSVLVTFMVMETWVLPLVSNGSPLGQLSILRLLRLLRITRMAKLMRTFPELLMIIKGIRNALKAVGWTAVLLVIVTYTWAILFTNEYHQGDIGDDDVDGEAAEALFGSMGKSMLSLLVMGTILDDVTFATDTIRSTENTMMLLAFIVYILINSFTMMNMLVGILVEVVGSTAESEKNRVLEEHVCETIKGIFKGLDQDGSGMITRSEFNDMLSDERVMAALQDLDIAQKQFEQYATLLFESDDDEPVQISFSKLLTMILRLRPGTAVSSLDFASFKQLVSAGNSSMGERIWAVEQACAALSNTTLPDGTQSMGWTGAGSLGNDIPRGSLANPKCLSQKPSSEAFAPGLLELGEEADHLPKINMQMLGQVERTPNKHIINELLRRLHLENIEETGISMAMLDEELQNRVRLAEEAMQSLENDGFTPGCVAD